MAPNNATDESEPLLEKVESPARTRYGSGAQQGKQLFYEVTRASTLGDWIGQFFSDLATFKSLQ
jgi:hypothetical protein